MRGSMKPDIEEAVDGADQQEVVDDGMDEQEGESEEARLGQTVDVPAEAVEQVKSLNFLWLKFNFLILGAGGAAKKRAQEGNLRHQHH